MNDYAFKGACRFLVVFAVLLMAAAHREPRGSAAVVELSCDLTATGSILTSDGTMDTFSGNAASYKDGSIRGEWEHVTASGIRITGEITSLTCQTISGSGPEQPGEKKGFTINSGNFGGPATWDGQPGYLFSAHVEDHGEPGEQDMYTITVVAPSGLTAYLVGGVLVSGNIQLHPPNNGHPAAP